MMADVRVDLVVGTYSRLGGRGLVPLAYHPAGNGWSPGDPVAAIKDASYGVHAPRLNLHYFVEESDEGRVHCHRAGDGWQQIAGTGTGGAAPCHLAIDAAERQLAVANYESGSVAVWQLGAYGIPVDPPAIYEMQGSGADPERQEHSHAHWVGFSADGKSLYCVDLGGDRIMTFPLDTPGERLASPRLAYRAPPGSGPRHLCFHPSEPTAFLVSELASTLTVLGVQPDGAFHALQTVSTLPDGSADSLGGAIAINRAGDRLYVTNRGHDSIAVFATDGTTATLMQHVPSGGASPRFILLLDDAGRLLVANEEGGSVGAFAIAPDGRLSADPLILDIPGAVFLARVGSDP